MHSFLPTMWCKKVVVEKMGLMGRTIKKVTLSRWEELIFFPLLPSAPWLQTSGRPPVSESLVVVSHVLLFATPWTAAHQASCPSLTPRACSNSCPLSWWCHPTISSSVAPLSSCPQSFTVSGSFPMSRSASGGQSIGASASVLPVNIQSWFPLGLTGLILQSKWEPHLGNCVEAWLHVPPRE